MNTAMPPDPHRSSTAGSPPPLPANRSRIDTIFDAALEKPQSEREAFLAEACGGDAKLLAEVRALLAADECAGGFLESDGPIAAGVATEIERLKPEEIGEHIGRYKLLQQIGEGGFGVVWMAEQVEPVQRRVALKIIKLGMDTKEVIARFEQERQALAMMEHPNIARVLDAGATPTGRPYFVMELVRGIRITDFCDQNHLSTAQRVELFVHVCRAVQHAHQKGVIHRDLKPSNILVTLHDGVPVPKVIDFGVAKATQRRLTERTLFTQFQQMVGTPIYMSPEQAEMSGLDIDTRSDIYSLGVLLYELLAGRTPFDPAELMRRGFDEIRRVIREVEPVRPSTALSTMAQDAQTNVARSRGSEAPSLIGMLRGDLDWIVMKCLEKDRTRRYETANDLAADLRRHLVLEPVLARPPSQLYRFRRMVRRNRVIFGTAAAAVLALAAGLALTAWQAVRASREAERAQKALAELREAAPAFRAQARVFAAQGETDKALEKLDYALNLQPKSSEYLLAKADLLESQLRLDEAAAAYRAALKVNPTDSRAEKHALLCEKWNSSTQVEPGKLPREALAELYSVMVAEHRPPVELMPIARLLGEEKALLLSFWLEKLKDLPLAGDPPVEKRLTMRPDGLLALDLTGSTIADLSPLAGMPLGSLSLIECGNVADLKPLEKLPLKELRLLRTAVSDLTPLRAVPTLEMLDLNESPVSDISALRGLKLTKLSLWNVSVSDLTPLGGMPLRQFLCSALPARDFSVLAGAPLEELTLHKTTIADLSLLRGMPLRELILSGSTSARGLNVLSEIPTLRGLVLPWPLQNLPNSELEAIAALRDHPALQQISAEFTIWGVNPRSSFTAKEDFFRDWDASIAWKIDLANQGATVELIDLADGVRLKIRGKQVNDLSPLTGMTAIHGKVIRELDIAKTAVSDLQPLAGMALRWLDATSTKVEDLTPIHDLPLTGIVFQGCPITNIEPLSGMMTLQLVGIGISQVRDLTPLAGLKIERLWLNKLKLQDLSPLRTLPLKELYMPDAEIADLSPLAGTPLERLQMGGAKIRDISPLADCTSLRYLWLSDCNISDIRPLAGLKISELHIGNTRVRDISPLRNMPLRVLTVDRCPVTDLSPLRDIPTLEELVASKESPGIWSLRTHAQLKYLSTVWDPRNNRPTQSVSEFWQRWDGKIR
jgi:serine/threonine protein kinase/Leucine-rich repeat (LRR) protein